MTVSVVKLTRTQRWSLLQMYEQRRNRALSWSDAHKFPGTLGDLKKLRQLGLVKCSVIGAPAHLTKRGSAIAYSILVELRLAGSLGSSIRPASGASCQETCPGR